MNVFKLSFVIASVIILTIFGLSIFGHLWRILFNYASFKMAEIDGFTTPKDIDEVVSNALKGHYGNYPERKYIIERMGYDYYDVQYLINRKISIDAYCEMDVKSMETLITDLMDQTREDDEDGNKGFN